MEETVKEEAKCPICREKVSIKDGRFVEHPTPAWNYAALKLGDFYRCKGSGMTLDKAQQ
jgi:hypothetical protein